MGGKTMNYKKLIKKIYVHIMLLLISLIYIPLDLLYNETSKIADYYVSKLQEFENESN